MRILIIAILFPWIALGQQKTDFKLLVDQANKYLEQYSKLTPYGPQNYPLSGLGYSRKEIKAMSKNPIFAGSFSASKDSVDMQALIAYFQVKISLQIRQIIKHPDFGKANIKDLIKSNELAIIVSDDMKLYNFSFDEKTGGTYRFRVSITHFTDFVPKDTNHLAEFNAVFESDGFAKILSIKTSEGTKYVLTSRVQGCAYCFESFVWLVTLNANVFKTDFRYSVYIRDPFVGVSYKHNNKTIQVNYFVDDLTPFCHCVGELTDDKYNSEGVRDMEFSTNCQCRFVFNGTTFELVEESWKKQKSTNFTLSFLFQNTTT